MKKSGSESIFDSLLYPDSTSDFHFHFRIDPDPCKTNTDPKHCSLVGPANFLGSPRIRICIFFLYFLSWLLFCCVCRAGVCGRCSVLAPGGGGPGQPLPQGPAHQGGVGLQGQGTGQICFRHFVNSFKNVLWNWCQSRLRRKCFGRLKRWQLRHLVSEGCSFLLRFYICALSVF